MSAPSRATARTASAARSGAGTRPRCRHGNATASSRRSAPSTGMPRRLGERDSRINCSCRVGGDAVEHDPAMRTARVVAAKPCTSAATERRLGGGVDDEEHRRLEQPGDVGGRALRGRATAVEQAHDALDDGDVRAAARRAANSGAMSSSPTRTGSRLRPGRPVARAW